MTPPQFLNKFLTFLCSGTFFIFIRLMKRQITLRNINATVLLKMEVL